MTERTVALVLVTFNRLEILKANLSCIENQTKKPDFIVIVNNGSTDGTTEFLKTKPKFYIINKEGNLGFGAGLAAGVSYAKDNLNPGYFWLMDDDSFPTTKVLSFLFEKAQKINLNGALGLTGFELKRGIPREVNAGNRITEVNFILVDNALVSRSAFDLVGNFREDLFMMCEDYDFCLRLKKSGLFVGVVQSEDVKVDRKHLGSQANSKGIIWRGYYHSRNHFLILKSNFSFGNLFFYFYRQLKYLIHSALFGKSKWDRFRFRILGIWHGMKGYTGKTLNPITMKISKN
ncbi:MAG: glycosyltransferase family 2 protein [Cyclobacteriaceae bacterium]|nr:glycosyltransferase family 2 protein [Cyclobacteriaceae bacterium]